ncbi:hypothetical protein [Falsiroseomonas tokyonensis]|uniref:Uncharacterized protein n=1 Tax=Falsiroseomonas tokyonensis TaxID=430521 RepID=A0ABV7C139_9PROT|nr:hypothetical protein [Falsiroseomonas tokyonensis]MBU8540026.1 hypothetical protein [Falsiroseomonas tokyonensis]
MTTNLRRTLQRPMLAAAALASVAAMPFPSLAQTSMGSREFQQAELSELSPALRSEVERRVAQAPGNTPRGVLESMLLNELQIREPASRIVGLDLGRGVVVIQQPSGAMKAYTFNKQEGLRVIGEVSLAR